MCSYMYIYEYACSKRSCKQTTQPLPTKKAAELGSKQGPRRVYSFRAPLRRRGPCEVSLHVSPNFVEMGDGYCIYV